MSAQHPPVRFLLVEDSEDDALFLQCELALLDAPVEIRRVDNAALLVGALREGRFDMVLSDFRLPAFSGMAALRLVREFDPQLPFILVSGRIGEEAAVEAMRAGANDYVMKGNLARLRPAVERELREAAMRREKRAVEARIIQLEHFDAETGLANRGLFSERLAQAAAAHGADIFGVVLLEIERFRSLQAAHSTDVVREIVRESASRLMRVLGGADRVARLGEDRFALIVPRARDARQVARAVEHLLNAGFDSPYATPSGAITVSARAGIALYPEDGAPATVLRHAEAALARAGQDRFVFYNPHMSAAIAERVRLEECLHRALAGDEFELHYQPQFGLRRMEITGLEALLRWRSPDLGMVMPARFVPLLEETGLILEVGAWVLRRAAADRRRWSSLGLQAPRVAVNVSMAQVRHRDFVQVVEDAACARVLSHGIDIEITESVLMSDVHDCVAKLEALRELGLRIVIDDFGVGYSSLSYLARLPVHALKIDRSFIAPMLEDAPGLTLVSSVANMARNFGLEVVAEGIEHPGQLDALRRIGCCHAQGYFLGRPASFDATSDLLRESQSRGIRPLAV